MWASLPARVVELPVALLCSPTAGRNCWCRIRLTLFSEGAVAVLSSANSCQCHLERHRFLDKAASHLENLREQQQGHCVPSHSICPAGQSVGPSPLLPTFSLFKSITQQPEVWARSQHARHTETCSSTTLNLMARLPQNFHAPPPAGNTQASCGECEASVPCSCSPGKNGSLYLLVPAGKGYGRRAVTKRGPSLLCSECGSSGLSPWPDHRYIGTVASAWACWVLWTDRL